ncbi:MAG: GNAT family N-acetyltransferase [Pseudomonadota bacterium]
MSNQPQDAVTIDHEEAGSKGRYVARVAGMDAEAELTYSRMSSQLIIVDHTVVPDDLRGKGLGAALAAQVVADARAQGFRIIPLCPFFKAQAGRHPEWADVLQG